jgi:hypothetical protein
LAHVTRIGVYLFLSQISKWLAEDNVQIFMLSLFPPINIFYANLESVWDKEGGAKQFKVN